jgi:hypothetical protein
MCNYKLTGHFFDIMKNLYKDVKYAIIFANEETCMFASCSDHFTRFIKYHNFSFVYIDTQILRFTVIRQLIQTIL